MVVYQAFYGEEAYWVRPEKMFLREYRAKRKEIFKNCRD